MSVLGPALCPNPCETCEKKGLPVLLVRAAVMAKELSAPELSGNFSSNATSSITLGEHAQYTQRLLRSGYVYVCDERYRDQWDEYFVTGDGYLTKLPKRMACSSIPPKPTATDFACARTGARPMASVITIRNAKHANTVWFGFSDVQWTDEVMRQHNDAAYRQLHMSKITVSGGKIAPQKWAEPLEQVRDLLPEYSGQMNNARSKALLQNAAPFQFNNRDAEWQSLMSAYKAMCPKGGAAIVMLADPVGIATEVAHLMEYRKVSFIARPEYQRPMSVASAIAGMEYALKEQAKLAEIEAGEMLAKRYEEGYETPVSMGAPDPMTVDFKMAARFRTITPAQLDKVAKDAWHEYTNRSDGRPRFDDNARLQWRKQFDTAQQAWDKEHILPLAKAHVAWLTSAPMQQCMLLNFDVNDLSSGVVYQSVFIMMIEHTSDKQPCIDQYNLWLEQGDTSNANLLMRALSFNQKQLDEQIKSTRESAIDWRVLPNDASYSVFKAVLTSLPLGAQAQAGKLIDLVSGNLLTYLNKLQAGTVNTKAAVAAFGSNGLRMTRIPITGNRGKFVQNLMNELLRNTSRTDISANQLGKAVASQLRLLEIEGLNMKGTHKQSWFAAMDREVLKGIPESVSGEEWARAAARAITKAEDLEKIDALAWRKLIGAKYAGGLLTGILQLANWTKLQSDWRDAMQQDKTDAMVRLGAGITAIAGTVTELSGNALAALPRFVPRMGEGAAQMVEKLAGSLELWGRRLGLVGAVVVAVMDGVKWREEDAKGNVGLSYLYFASSVTGFALGFELFYLSGLLALPFGVLVLAITLVAFIVITVLIEKNKNNKIQEWLSRCLWGTASDKYGNMLVEKDELLLALK
jgi:hypothetical protein